MAHDNDRVYRYPSFSSYVYVSNQSHMVSAHKIAYIEWDFYPKLLCKINLMNELFAILIFSAMLWSLTSAMAIVILYQVFLSCSTFTNIFVKHNRNNLSKSNITITIWISSDWVICPCLGAIYMSIICANRGIPGALLSSGLLS